MHHQATDLRGFLNFLELWAQINRGEDIDFTTISTNWTRDPIRFFAGVDADLANPPTPPGFMIVPPADADAPSYITQPAAVTRWTISKASMERLKTDFLPSTSDSWISSGDAISTLLWGVLTRARHSAGIGRTAIGRSSEESQTETLIAAADGRDRAPDGNMMNGQYFGNFNPLYATTVARSDLLSLESEAASRVALAIRNALKAQLVPSKLAEKIQFLENAQNRKPPARVGFAADVIMTNWSRNDLQGPKMDFGEGRPFVVTAGAGSSFPPAFILLTQDKVSGDSAVLLTVEADAVALMNGDRLLNQYATLVKLH